MTNPDPTTPAGDTPKDAAAVRIFPPAAPLLTVLAGIGLERMFPLGSSLMPQAPFRYWVGGAVILASIYLLGFRAIKAVRRSGQSENPYKETTEIIETAPFSYTRNPMYLQMLLVCIGVSIFLANVWIFVLTPVCAVCLYFFAILPEERYLERKFGETYLDYKRRVRRWM